MVIYIEKFLFQNIIINFCLLRLVYLTSRFKTSTPRQIFSATIGAIFSVLVASRIYNITYVNIIKFLCSIIMIICAFKTNFKQFIYSFILLFIYTYALGGAIMTISSNSTITTNGIIMTSKFNLDIVTLLIIFLSYIFEISLKQTKNRLLNGNFIYSIELILKNKIIKLKAFIDTGNNLSYNGQPVIVLDSEYFFKLIDLSNYLNLNPEKISSSTIFGNKNLQLYQLDELKIYTPKTIKTIKNQYVALDFTHTFKHTNYQALLSPALI